jgi:hypothetical protein
MLMAKPVIMSRAVEHPKLSVGCWVPSFPGLQGPYGMSELCTKRTNAPPTITRLPSLLGIIPIICKYSQTLIPEHCLVLWKLRSFPPEVK